MPPAQLREPAAGGGVKQWGRPMGLWRNRIVKLAMATAILSPFSAPFAQDQESVLEEVVVTATKRSESIQNVSTSITAVSGDALQERGIKSSQELLQTIPSTDLQLNNGSTTANIFIRGVGTKGPGYNQVSAVGVYSDEVSLNSPVVNVLQLFDIERVEVLRGPQNTLYGRNTTGGAINFISKRPEVGQAPEGYANISYGKYNQIDGEGAVGFGMGDTAAMRLSAQVQQRDGVVNNTFLNSKAYDRNTWAGRAQIVLAPSDNFTAFVKGHIERVDNINKLWKALGLQNPANPAQPCTSKIGLGSPCVSTFGVPSSPNDLTSFESNLIAPIEKVNSGGVSLTMDWAFDAATLTSITAFEQNSYRKAEDVDATRAPVNRTGPFPQPAFDFFQLSHQKQWSQELRLASPAQQDFRWIGGVFGFGEDLVGNTTAIPYFGSMVNSTRLDQNLKVLSAYGDAEYDVAEGLTLAAGVRYSYEKQDGVNDTAQRSLLDAAVAAALLPTTGQKPITTADLLALPTGMGMTLAQIPFEKSWKDWGGKVGVKYRQDDDILWYANVSRGFKAGSYSPAPAQTLNGKFSTPTNPEYLTALDGGVKSTLMEGHLRANLSTYYYWFKDQQLLRVTDVPGFGISAVQVNAGKSHVYGTELETQYAAGNGIFFDLSLGLMKTRLDRYTEDCAPRGVGECPASGVINFAGSKLPNSPKVTISAGLRKEWDLTADNTLSIGGDLSHRSSRFFDLPNTVNESDGSYTVFNAQGAITFGEGGMYKASIWGKNITKQIYFLNLAQFDSVGTIEGLVNDPRTFGATLGVKF